MAKWFSTRVLRQWNGDRIVFSINGAETTGYPHVKEWSWIPTSHSIQWIIDLNVGVKTIKLSEENIGVSKSSWPWIRQWFLIWHQKHKW